MLVRRWGDAQTDAGPRVRADVPRWGPGEPAADRRGGPGGQSGDGGHDGRDGDVRRTDDADDGPVPGPHAGASELVMEAIAGASPFLLFLVCPISMAIGMWLMGRAMRPREAPKPVARDEATRTSILEAENVLLKDLVRRLSEPAVVPGDRARRGQ